MSDTSLPRVPVQAAPVKRAEVTKISRLCACSTWALHLSIHFINQLNSTNGQNSSEYIRMQRWKPAYFCCTAGNAFKSILHRIHRTLEKSLSSKTPSAASWLALGDCQLGLASLISCLSFSLMFWWAQVFDVFQ